MSDAAQLPPWMFKLEGTFLGFVSNSLNTIDSIVFEVDHEQMVITLTEKLYAAVQRYCLQPGDGIQCIGRSQIDFESRVIQLNASYLVPLSPRPTNDAWAVSLLKPLATKVRSEKVSAGLSEARLDPITPLQLPISPGYDPL